MTGNPVQRANEALRDTDRIHWLATHLPTFLEKAQGLSAYRHPAQFRDLLDRMIIDDMQRFIDRALVLEQARKDRERQTWEARNGPLA